MRVTYIFLSLYLICGSVLNAQSIDAIQAISLEQIFTDGVKREGTVIVAGSVSNLKIKRSPFDDKITNLTMAIEDKGWSLHVSLDDYQQIDTFSLEEGRLIAIKGKMLLLGNSGFITGTIQDGNINIATYTPEKATARTAPEVIAIENYFNDHRFVGGRTVLLQGAIKTRSIAGDGSVLFVLSYGSHSVYAYSNIWEFNIDANKEKLRALEEGTTVTLLGSFSMEGSTTVFTFTSIQ